jgi:hypothetical protein
LWTGVRKTIFLVKKQALPREMIMEELHRIHKDVPFGYWVMWLEPAFKALARKWGQERRRHSAGAKQITLR